MPSPVRGQSGDRPITQIPSALADMLAAALRGGVKATMGMPGDLEGLGRAGLNKLGAGVDPTPALPTSDFMNEWLPSDGGRMPTAEKLGEFLPLPMTLGVGQAAKQVSPMVKALRGAEAPVDMGRRDALQTMGKAGAGVAAATVAPHMMVEALRAAPEAGAVAKAVAPTAARVAAGASRSTVLAALNKMRAFTDYPPLKDISKLKNEYFDPEAVISKLQKVAGSDEGMENMLKIFNRGNPGEEHMGNPEYAQASHWLSENSKPEEILEAARSGKMPEHWAKNGVTEDHLADELFPVTSGPNNRKIPGTDLLADDVYQILFHED